MNKHTIQNILYTIIVIVGIGLTIYYFFNTEKEYRNPANLEVQLIDVGQADCILIRNNNHNM